MLDEIIFFYLPFLFLENSSNIPEFLEILLRSAGFLNHASRNPKAHKLATNLQNEANCHPPPHKLATGGRASMFCQPKG